MSSMILIMNMCLFVMSKSEFPPLRNVYLIKNCRLSSCRHKSDKSDICGQKNRPAAEATGLL
jgi:hypothetical protein